jgi:hypothetical protein
VWWLALPPALTVTGELLAVALEWKTHSASVARGPDFAH